MWAWPQEWSSVWTCGNDHSWRINGVASLETKGIMDSTKLSTYILSISRFVAVLCLIGYGVYAMKVI
jgi:hypothetical protein